VSVALTYVYCLVRSARRPSLRGVPEGMPGGETVRLVDLPPATAASRRAAQRQWLAVSTVPQTLYGEAVLENDLQDLGWVGPRALAHEAVVEHFLGADAVLPMQLFTLFKSDARAVEHVVADRRRIARILTRIERQVEWGLRLAWDRSAGEQVSTASHRRRAARPGEPTGAGYLMRKKAIRDASRLRLRRARADATRIHRTIAGQATAARRRTDVERAARGSRLLLDAAYLVPAARTKAFEASVRRQTASLERTGVVVTLTGPWPAYHFI
jgi:gas vesicle protein GvpL/GvpF